MAVNDSQPGLHGGGGRFVFLVHHSYGVKIFYQAKVTNTSYMEQFPFRSRQ